MMALEEARCIQFLFALSRRPPPEWSDLFIHNWNRPPSWTTMHRPGIAEITGSTVSLNGTTIEEVERYHRDTLQLVINETNRQYREWQSQQDKQKAQEKAQSEEHRRRVNEGTKRIKFD